MGIVRAFCLVLGLALGTAAPARADMAKFETALALFNEANLWRDGGLPGGGATFPLGGVYRFNTGLRVFVGGSTTSSVREHVEKTMRAGAEISGLALEFVDSAEKANVKFNFFQEYMAPPGLPSAGCVTQPRRTGAVYVEMTVHIRITQRTCVVHEIMHAFGFMGHPHDFDTVLSYTRRGASQRETFTELDQLLLRTLYRANIAPGTFHLPALVRVRQFLAEELKIIQPSGDASGLARAFMDKQVERLRGVADPYIQMQLGNAYAFGHYVAVDQAEAVRFWQLAADKNNSESAYRLGLALRAGQGIAADASAARTRLRTASELGHSQAPRALGDMLRDGEGGAADPVEAFAYFDLAERRGVTAATGPRAVLADGFDAATKARAAARAAELPTTPPRPAQ